MLDTNVAWRRIQKTDPHYADIKSAIDAFVIAGEQICITAQNLIEFRAVATRPQTANGLGFTSAEAIIAASEIESLFDLLPETPDIYPKWRELVGKYGVAEKQVHDARLVPVMLVHGITHLLTLNGADFRRFSEISVIEP